MVQLVVIWGIFLPQPIAAISAGIIILSQTYLITSGNYSWLNWLTIVLALSCFSDPILTGIAGIVPPDFSALPNFFHATIIILSLIVIYLSIGPVRNMLSSHQ